MNKRQYSTFHRAQLGILKYEKCNHAAKIIRKCRLSTVTWKIHFYRWLQSLYTYIHWETEWGCPGMLSIRFLFLIGFCDHGESPLKQEECLLQSKNIHVKINHYPSMEWKCRRDFLLSELHLGSERKQQLINTFIQKVNKWVCCHFELALYFTHSTKRQLNDWLIERYIWPWGKHLNCTLLLLIHNTE